MFNRVTMHSTSNLMNFYITRNFDRLGDLYEVVSTNKRINRPSDDPAGAGKVIDYRQYISRAEQFMRNIENGRVRLSTAETAIGQASEILVQAKGTALEMASGTITADDREIAATEVEGMIELLLGLANTRHNGAHLFSGQALDTPPFELDDTGEPWTVTYTGDNEATEIQINEAVNQRINIDGEEVFLGSVGGAASGVDVFQTLIGLREALLADDIDGVQAQIDNLDAVHQQLVQARADAGLRISNLETHNDSLDFYIMNLTAELSTVEDADSIKAINDLTLAEATLQATLQAATMIQNVTILKYL